MTGNGAMTGYGRLVRLILRRDRWLLPLWAVLPGVVAAAYVSAFNGFFTTDQDRVDYARESMSNTGFVALYGPLHGSSVGDLVAWRFGFLPVIIGLCAMLTVIRHTRADEEAGRSELIGSAVVGRRAQLTAALVTTGAASLLLGVVLTLALTGSGLGATGSLAMGAEFTLAGWMFAGVAAIAAQLTDGARGARSAGIGTLAFAYALRLGGDASESGDGRLSWLSWISPLGWLTRIFPYAERNLLPMLLAVLFTAAAIAVGLILLGRRDLGAGLFPARLGRPSASAGLGTPLALAWRLHRGLLAAWTVGFVLLGLIFGSVGGSIIDLDKSNGNVGDVLSRMGGSSVLVDAYFSSIAGIIGLIAACYAVQAALRLRDEELRGHAELVLSTAVGRYAWAGSHLLFSLLGPAVALVAEGLAAGLVYGHGRLGGVVASSLVQLPAVWVLAGVTVLLFGLLPRWSAVAWAGPALCLLVLFVGETMQLNHWLLDVSPFTHVPHVPGDDVTATPVISLLVVALALAAAGLAALRHRGIPA